MAGIPWVRKGGFPECVSVRGYPPSPSTCAARTPAAEDGEPAGSHVDSSIPTLRRFVKRKLHRPAPLRRTETGVGHPDIDAVAGKPHTPLTHAYKAGRYSNTIVKATAPHPPTGRRHRNAPGIDVCRSRGRPREREQISVAGYRTVVLRRRMPAPAAPTSAMASAQSAQPAAAGRSTPG